MTKEQEIRWSQYFTENLGNPNRLSINQWLEKEKKSSIKWGLWFLVVTHLLVLIVSYTLGLRSGMAWWRDHKCTQNHIPADSIRFAEQTPTNLTIWTTNWTIVLTGDTRRPASNNFPLNLR